MTEEAERLRQAAAGLSPARNPAEASPLRIYYRENYDELCALKVSRGLSWSQMAAVLTKLGLTKANGATLDGNAVAVMAAQVRWEREPGSRQKRKKVRRKGKATPAGTDARSKLGPLLIAPEPSSAPTPAPRAPLPPTLQRSPEDTFVTHDPDLDRALNIGRKLTPLRPMGVMDTQGRRNLKPGQEKQDDGDEDG